MRRFYEPPGRSGSAVLTLGRMASTAAMAAASVATWTTADALDVGRRRAARAPRREPEARRLGQAATGVRDLAELATEPDFAEERPSAAQRPVGERARPRPAPRRGRPPARTASRRRRSRRRRPGRRRADGAPLEHGQQHRQPAGIDALGVAPRPGRPVDDRDGERLHLDEQRALALASPARRPTPATPSRRSARNSCEGSATPARPWPVISNRPSSSVAPKRCLTARSMRRAW